MLKGMWYSDLGICQRRVCEAVERGEAVGVLPNLLVVGVEDVRAVAVDGNAADVLGVDVARDVAPLVDYKHALAFSFAICANAAPNSPAPTTR